MEALWSDTILMRSGQCHLIVHISKAAALPCISKKSSEITQDNVYMNQKHLFFSPNLNGC